MQNCFLDLPCFSSGKSFIDLSPADSLSFPSRSLAADHLFHAIFQRQAKRMTRLALIVAVEGH
jgi:hypothetical protein